MNGISKISISDYLLLGYRIVEMQLISIYWPYSLQHYKIHLLVTEAFL